MLRIYPYHQLESVPEATRNILVVKEPQLAKIMDEYPSGHEFVLITDAISYRAKWELGRMHLSPHLYHAAYIQNTAANGVIFSDLSKDRIGHIEKAIDSPKVITSTPPVVDQSHASATLDDLTEIIRSSAATTLSTPTYVDYTDYLKDITAQADKLNKLVKLYDNADRWVKALNATKWDCVLLKLINHLIECNFAAPTFYRV